MGTHLDARCCMTEHNWTQSPDEAMDKSSTGLVLRGIAPKGARRAPLEQLESFLARVPFGIILLDEKLQIEHANTALASVMGVPECEFVGQPLEVVLPHIADKLLPVVRQVLATGEDVPELSFSASPPNNPAAVRNWLAVVSRTDKDERTTGVGVAIRDITHRARARERDERRLRHREGLYALTAALVEATTPQEVVQATLTHAKAAFNAAGVVVARRTPDGSYVELLDADGMPPDVAEEWRRFPVHAPVPLAYVARTGESLFLQSAADWEHHFPELARLAGELGHSANMVVPLTLDPTPIGALGIAFHAMRGFDDEDRAVAQIIGRHCALALERARLLEAERAARAEAVTANRVKTKFMATMNHELRTPLNAIAGYTELLQMGVQGPLTDGQRDALARIQRNLQHLLGLIGSILSLMKAESGQQEYTIAEVAMDAVLQFVAEATAPQLAANNSSSIGKGCAAAS